MNIISDFFSDFSWDDAKAMKSDVAVDFGAEISNKLKTSKAEDYL